MTDITRDALDVITYLEHELAHQDTIRRVVDGFEQEAVEEIVAYFQAQKMTISVEPRDTENSFLVFITR